MCKVRCWHWLFGNQIPIHLRSNPGANLKSISHRCYLREVAFEWELTQETFYLPLSCLQGGSYQRRSGGCGQGWARLLVWDVAEKTRGEEIVIMFPNNQRQHRTLHIQKDALPYALC